MNNYLDLFRKMQINKAGLQKALGDDLHNVVCEKPCVIKRRDVIDVMCAFIEKRICIDTLVEWVNVTWFTDLFTFAEKDTDSIISVFEVLETMDEEDVCVTEEKLKKMIATLEVNGEYEQ